MQISEGVFKMAVYALVCLTGGVLLGLELLASRIMAPFFGTSIFVWGAIISVFLLSLSVGYAVGGRVADRLPTFGRLALTILASAATTVIIPFMSTAVSYGTLSMVGDLRLAVLLACVVLFLVPSVLMGMVSPYVIKLTARRLEDLGQTAGNIYAFSTLGSIGGTIGTSFYLIPSMGAQSIVLLLSGLLVLAALLAFVLGRVAPPAPEACGRGA